MVAINSDRMQAVALICHDRLTLVVQLVHKSDLLCLHYVFLVIAEINSSLLRHLDLLVAVLRLVLWSHSGWLLLR